MLLTSLYKFFDLLNDLSHDAEVTTIVKTIKYEIFIDATLWNVCSISRCDNLLTYLRIFFAVAPTPSKYF